MSTQLIIGLGTGRCGTRSLARLLRLQPGASARHERKPALPWENESDPGRHLRKHRPGVTLRADVGFYYLPYVERLREEFPGIRFVCLQRDREETITSFCRQLPRSRRWFDASGCPWSRCFPVIRQNSFERQAAAYWDLYYETAERLEGDDFRIFPTETLTNDPASILEFCGVTEPVIKPCHVGAGMA